MPYPTPHSQLRKVKKLGIAKLCLPLYLISSMSKHPQPPSDNDSASRASSGLLQVTFSDQSMAQLNALPPLEQLRLMDIISAIRADDLKNPNGDLGRFSRAGVNYYRVRAGDFRCYFEVRGDTLFSHYITHKNTLTDFVFRTKLPISEETMIEQHKSFWKYLESVTKTDSSSKSD